MKRRLSALVIGALLALSAVGIALGNTGYEGQPGGQSHGGGGGNSGYEGQPGNQSH